MKWGRYSVIALGVFGAAWIALAQRDEVGRRFRGTEVNSARPFDENSTPMWTNDVAFTNDVFTFARLQYTAQHDRYGRGHVDYDLRWLIDFPACDLDLSYRLQQMTSI